MPAGLKGALLGFGNPLLDISAGARDTVLAFTSFPRSRCRCRTAVQLAGDMPLASARAACAARPITAVLSARI